MLFMSERREGKKEKKSKGIFFPRILGFALYFIISFPAQPAVLKSMARVAVIFTKHNHFPLFVFGLWQYKRVSCYIRD